MSTKSLREFRNRANFLLNIAIKYPDENLYVKAGSYFNVTCAHVYVIPAEAS